MYMCLNSDRTPQACWSPMVIHRHFGFQWEMSVSDGTCRSQMGHVCLRWGTSVSDRSPMGHVGLRLNHIEFSDGSARGYK